MAIKCQILIVSLGKPFLGTYWAFSHARKLKIENGFLHCNQHLELQVLSTHMTYFWDNIFLTFNRAIMNFKLKTRHGSHWSFSIFWWFRTSNCMKIWLSKIEISVLLFFTMPYPPPNSPLTPSQTIAPQRSTSIDTWKSKI